MFLWTITGGFGVLMFLWTITGVWSLDVPLDYHWGLESWCSSGLSLGFGASVDVTVDYHWGLESWCCSGLSLGFGVLMLLRTVAGVWSLDVARDCRWGLESWCRSGLSLGPVVFVGLSLDWSLCLCSAKVQYWGFWSSGLYSCCGFVPGKKTNTYPTLRRFKCSPDLIRPKPTPRSPWYNRNGWLGVKHQVFLFLFF